MSGTGVIGVKGGNIIVPINNLMKQTKQVTLTLSNTPAGWVTKVAKAIFYSDAANNWFMEFNVAGTHTLTGGPGGITVNIDNVLLLPNVDTIDGVWGIQATGSRIGFYPTSMVGAVDTTGGCRLMSLPFTITGVAANIGDLTTFSGTVPLKQEPTTYTTSANMENVANIAAYIPFGQAGMPGEVIEATLTDVSMPTGGGEYTVGTLPLTSGKWQVFAKASIPEPSAAFCDCSISLTSASRHLPSMQRETSSDATTRMIGSDRYISLTTASNVYMIASCSSSNASCVAENSQFYAIRLTP